MNPFSKALLVESITHAARGSKLFDNDSVVDEVSLLVRVVKEKLDDGEKMKRVKSEEREIERGRRNRGRREGGERDGELWRREETGRPYICK